MRGIDVVLEDGWSLVMIWSLNLLVAGDVVGKGQKKRTN